MYEIMLAAQEAGRAAARAGTPAQEVNAACRRPIEDATAAFWSAVHGVTSLLIAGFWKPGAPAVALVCDAMIAQLTRKEAVHVR